VAWERPNYPHVLSIAHALKPLISIARSDISVLYVPLVWPAADSAALRALLTTANMIQNRRDELLEPDTGPCLKKDPLRASEPIALRKCSLGQPTPLVLARSWRD
jgi:hypothetical protein